MPKTVELPQLAEFAAEAPKRRIGLIRHLWPSIRACLDAGHSVRAVQARLNADGLSIPYSTLCWAIASLRKSGQFSERSAPPKVGEIRMPKVAGTDPLANLHRIVQSRPGFEYTGTMSDEELFGKK
jgi:hypothetical protein